MTRKGLMLATWSVAAFTAGAWFGRTPTVRALPAARVFELRTYTANPGKLGALEARFRDHTVRLFEKHGIQNVGYWRAIDAPAAQSTLVYILAHRDRESARRSWEAFRADPEWQKAKAASEVGGPLVAKADSMFLAPTDYSPIQ